MRKILSIVALCLLVCPAFSQYKTRLAANATLGISPNIETYFFVEKLAVEHIGNYVFDIKGTDYTHQPMVNFSFQHFQRLKNDPLVIRAAEIMRQIRDTLYDNGPILNYLLNQKDFPAKGPRFTGGKIETAATGKLRTLLPELADSLRKFYSKANVAGFMKQHSSYYQGALKEVAKDISRSAYPSIEQWYGRKFPRYELYISPAMPITPGEDSYRGFGPDISSPQGKIPSMVISSSKMLPAKDSLPLYRQYGFDNPSVTQFLTIHEISHSFVNPLLQKYEQQLKADSSLLIKEWRDTLAQLGMRDWQVCVTEHLVRLGEIRIAMASGKAQEAARLRELHIGEFHCVLIPLLEEQIKAYEANRGKYPSFEAYLPQLMQYLHHLTPQQVKEQWLKYQHYPAVADKKS